MVAILAIEHPTDPLESVFKCAGRKYAAKDRIATNLTDLASSIDAPEVYPDLQEFVDACKSTTSKRVQRQARHRWFCRALTEKTIRIK
jgi:hypothetical protein